MSTFKARPYLLKGKIQDYAWGTKNDNAFIPQFLNIAIEKDKPYAELWMGSHSKAPAELVINDNNIPLDKLIREFPDNILGSRVYSRFNGLPFLFKVLSAGEALSIQAHPNKEQAKILHTRDPQHYPDDNHKPEIAIALSELTALAGFKTFSQIIAILENYPEITTYIGPEILQEMKQVENSSVLLHKQLLKKMYRVLMKRSLSHQDILLKAIEDLERRLLQKEDLTEAEEIFFELRKIYPGPDSGLFSLFLLNLVHLKPGEGLFLKAGLPHAYLRGNIVECMANSDNVVRAGLTPKFQDVDTLIEILTYEMRPIEIQKGAINFGELVYNTPVAEFQISRLDLNQKPVVQKTNSLQILLVTLGQITISWAANKADFIKGQAILIPANLSLYSIKSSTRATLFKVIVP
jgi:mannose-6-phosphate isomerase